jgi:hypothetical protein
MSFELGGSTLEIAIGLAFVFFLLSVIVSAVTEGISWRKGKRAAKLREGLVGMLGHEFATDVLSHPLAKNDLSDTAAGKDPSYLSPRNFALALVQLLDQKGEADDDPFESVKKGVKALEGESGDAKALAKQLNALLGEAALAQEAEKRLGAFRKSAEAWFDDTMDRVSGWYKRWSQLVNLGIALIVAIGLNASAIRIAERLAGDQTVRSAVVAGAQNATAGESTPKASGEAAQAAVEELKSLQVPLLWTDDNNPFHDFGFWEFVTVLVGWALTAIAISLGAPFWFDALSKLARLKTTGAKPEKAATS